jgi:hypothetical protein
MRKTVKCSACGKEHDIVTEWAKGGYLEIVGFEPVKSVRDRLFEDIHRNIQTLDIAGEIPHKLYLGNKEIACLSEGCLSCDTAWGFEIVEVDKCSYFHATGKK